MPLGLLETQYLDYSTLKLLIELWPQHLGLVSISRQLSPESLEDQFQVGEESKCRLFHFHRLNKVTRGVFVDSLFGCHILVMNLISGGLLG